MDSSQMSFEQLSKAYQDLLAENAGLKEGKPTPVVPLTDSVVEHDLLIQENSKLKEELGEYKNANERFRQDNERLETKVNELVIELTTLKASSAGK